MIRFDQRTGQYGPVLVARIPGMAMASDDLPDHSRHLQVRLLIDAAAALLEDDADYETEYEALHGVMESLPTETREGA